MMTDVWVRQEAGPLTVYSHDGSYAHGNSESVAERLLKALNDVCHFLGVSPDGLPPISVYLHEVLEGDPNAFLPGGNATLDIDNAAIHSLVTSESPGVDPEFALTLLVLHLTRGPAAPEGRFWEDGLAGYLAGKGGSAFWAEAPARVQ
jgi:hypothetical protein